MNSDSSFHTRPPLHIQPSSQKIPPMPFSSPIVDEVSSPSSSSSHGRPTLYGRRAYTQNEVEREKTRPPRRSSSVQRRPSHNKGYKKENVNRSRHPGLNLITDFSKAATTCRDARHNSTTGKDMNTTRRGLVNAVDDVPKKREPRSTHGGGDVKGPVHSLKRAASSKIFELSPSDREVIIGLSVPSTRHAGYSSGPVKDEQPTGTTTQQYANDSDPPVTPSIVITPAKDEAPWHEDSVRLQTYQRRPASSIYSRATHYGRGTSHIPEIPPVPKPPAGTYYFHKPSNTNTSDRRRSTKLQPRPVSTYTEFAEDDSPTNFIEGRPYSGESQLEIFNRSSIDTITTKRRSQGWWNYVVSPFVSRSGTWRTAGSPRVGERTPDIVYTPQIGAEPDSPEKEDTHQVPLSENERVKSDCTVWTDLSRWESQREKDKNLNNDRTMPEGLNRRDSRLPNSPGQFSPQTEGFGAASEYYRACWHDQNSPTVYFKCHNHVCLPKDAVLQGSERAIRDVDHEDGELHPTFDSEKDADQKQKTAPEIQVPENEIRGSALEKLEEPCHWPEIAGIAESQHQQRNNEFRQAPANRFSAAFGEATKEKRRPMSENTMIEEDIETTPEVIEARAAPVVRAMLPKTTALPPLSSIGADNRKISVDSTRPSLTPSRQLPPYSPPRSERILKRARAMPLEDSHVDPRMPLSPGPITPNTEKLLSKHGGTSLVHVLPETRSVPTETTEGMNHYYQSPSNNPVTLATSDRPPRSRRKPKTIRKYSEKGRQRYLEPKQRKCSVCRDWLSKLLPKDKKKRWIYLGVTVGLLTIIAVALALAMTLTRRGDAMLVQTDWLNITGYPPIPTGISTVANPDAAKENSGCVHPSTMWSCSVPKEQQAAIAPNDADQPNFRIEIRFKNSTQGSTSHSTQSRKRSLDRVANAVSASNFIRHRLLNIRDALFDTLYTPNPSPPSQEDQAFLGNTTDKNTAPYDGEDTPFFISFLSAAQASSSLKKRDTQIATNNSTDPFPDITSAIPPPDINSNGTASRANLLPFPSAQPLRLFNRGLLSEHYGFYSYFDRSIFLKSTSVLNSSDTTIGDVPDDENGGATEDAATVRCTWTQTRFLVQIWTNRQGSANLLSRPANAPTSTSSTNPTQTSNATTSSANDFTRPGSFKYPITITLDRHGGDVTKKMIYCYGMDNRERIISDEKKVQLEDRAFGGALVNPALGFAGAVNAPSGTRRGGDLKASDHTPIRPDQTALRGNRPEPGGQVHDLEPRKLPTKPPFLFNSPSARSPTCSATPKTCRRQQLPNRKRGMIAETDLPMTLSEKPRSGKPPDPPRESACRNGGPRQINPNYSPDDLATFCARSRQTDFFLFPGEL